MELSEPARDTPHQRAPRRAEAPPVPAPAFRAAPRGDTRTARGLLQLQATRGNQYVQRLLKARRGDAAPAGGAGLHIQRYAVGAPRNADCAAVIDWLNSNSPYSPAWAKTRVRLSWSGTIEIAGSAPDFIATVPAGVVTVRKRVDMPRWRPSDPAMLAAWQSMHGELRAHEAEHEAIADTWRDEMETRLREIEVDVTASSERQARARARATINSDWRGWLDEHQAEQDSIDPYVATLICPAEPEEEGAAEEGAAETPAG